MAVLITGATRGIGARLRAHYLNEGHQVWATYRGEPPGESGWIPLDLRSPDDFSALASALDGVPIDLLICSAGVYPDKGMNLADDYRPEVWAESFAVNVTGVFLTIQALLANLQIAKQPRIAILGSNMGCASRPGGGSYAYRASKAAVLNLGRNLATDLHDLGISVGIYHPGWVRTEMGGPKASLDVDTSVAGLVDRIAALNLETSGCFEAWDGTAYEY